MAADTAVDAAEFTTWVGLAVWGSVLVAYMFRSWRAGRRPSPTGKWIFLPSFTMIAVGVVEVAANITIIVVESPTGRVMWPIWWAEHLLAVVFWAAMTVLVIVFEVQSRRRRLAMSTRVSRYEYRLALESRRSRAHAARLNPPGVKG